MLPNAPLLNIVRHWHCCFQLEKNTTDTFFHCKTNKKKDFVKVFVKYVVRKKAIKQFIGTKSNRNKWENCKGKLASVLQMNLNLTILLLLLLVFWSMVTRLLMLMIWWRHHISATSWPHWWVLRLFCKIEKIIIIFMGNDKYLKECPRIFLRNHNRTSAISTSLGYELILSKTTGFIN